MKLLMRFAKGSASWHRAESQRLRIGTIADFVNLVDFLHFMTVEQGFNGGTFYRKSSKKLPTFTFIIPTNRL